MYLSGTDAKGGANDPTRHHHRAACRRCHAEPPGNLKESAKQKLGERINVNAPSSVTHNNPFVPLSLKHWTLKGHPRAINRARTDSDLRSLVPFGSPRHNLSRESPTRRSPFKRSEQQSNRSVQRPVPLLHPATHVNGDFCYYPSLNESSSPLCCVQRPELWAQADCLTCCWRPPTGASCSRWAAMRAWIARRAWTPQVNAGITGTTGAHRFWGQLGQKKLL